MEKEFWREFLNSSKAVLTASSEFNFILDKTISKFRKKQKSVGWNKVWRGLGDGELLVVAQLIVGTSVMQRSVLS